MAYNVLVIGDSCIDRFQYGKVDRICPEAPCPVFVSTYMTENDGMAGNVVANLKAFNGNIDIDFITNKQKPIKTRFVEEKSNQMIMRLDEEDIIRGANLKGFDFDKYESVVVSDYDKGFLGEDDLRYISRVAKLSFIDTKKILGDWAKDFTFIKINEQEYQNSAREISDHISRDRLIVTMGAKGAKYKLEMFPAEKVNIVDISGAGDTFLAALVYKYLQTNSIQESIIFANTCSAKVITKRGTSTL